MSSADPETGDLPEGVGTEHTQGVKNSARRWNCHGKSGQVHHPRVFLCFGDIERIV